MKYIKTCTICFIAFCVVASFLPLSTWAGDWSHPSTYMPRRDEIHKHKKSYDDPRPILTTLHAKKVLPPEMWKALSFDVDKMKELWAEVVGFRAPDIVGKIAPEIKPGKYTFQDKEKYPGLKELMIPLHYEKHFNPGGPPFAGNFPEFEIIPTRQYYYSLPVGEATKKNEGKTKISDNGYIKQETWISGFPFPKPSGKFKGWQIVWNTEKRHLNFNLNMYLIGDMHGYNKNLVRDFEGGYNTRIMRLSGRVLFPPYGWLDARAEKRRERNTYVVGFPFPRDIAGAAQAGTRYEDYPKSEQMYMYVPAMRRVRKLSATDTQDPVMGQDVIYDDLEGWNQKLAPNRYPYTVEVIDEREFLIPAPTLDGSEYIASEGVEIRGLRMERRPMYVVKLTQLDPNYVYSYRIFYIDKETFVWPHVENYDQKGRLYRTLDLHYGFHPEMGHVSWSGAILLMRDWIDTHSTIGQNFMLPALWSRKDMSLRHLVKKGK